MYIHKSSCISPQQSFWEINLQDLNLSKDNKLITLEPKYKGIPVNLLRRMGKAVRIGVGAALPLIETNEDIKGIIIGTANGGMEDCIKFLNQIIKFEEGALTPTNFVQSTPNAISSGVGLLSANFGYNTTHSHRGLSFENALLDAKMLLLENPDHIYLVGGVDEISTYNYNIDFLGGWYKKETLSNTDLYKSTSFGSIAGEGSAIYLVSNEKQNAEAHLHQLVTLHTSDKDAVVDKIKQLAANFKIAMFISGENGDIRLKPYYQAAEAALPENLPVARFKHLSGEYPTASSFAFWLAIQKAKGLSLPDHIMKSGTDTSGDGNILIYNNYKGEQHSLILISGVS
ncbi:MAG: beta-ketoacyl synthase chain length factor [Candidatus Cyclobacteriaceae bacterium M2_1C_046]